MRKKISSAIAPFLAAALFFCQNAAGQSEFYSPEMLQSDLKQVDVVAYVEIKQRKLTDSIGGGDCEKDTGTGYCLYLLKAEVKEMYKGKTAGRYLEFYESPDADYPKKLLMGEKIVFLEWSSNSPDRKASLFALQNSTRSIEQNVIEKMRKLKRKMRDR